MHVEATAWTVAPGLEQRATGEKPDFADMTIEWAMHGVMGRPGLDLVPRQLLLIGTLTTLGFATAMLRAPTEAALTARATVAAQLSLAGFARWGIAP